MSTESGHRIVLRGVSLSSDAKWSPSHVSALGAEEMRRIRGEFGFNAIRLLVFWQAIEPIPGRYSQSYLDAVAQMVRWANREGIAVIVDMHQDLYGAGFGQAGAPIWTCDLDAYASFSAPTPWFMGYLEPQVEYCFKRLFRHPETRAAFASAWGALAHRLNEVPGVFAYELLNEPFWGSEKVQEFERNTLPWFYSSVAKIVRHEDRRPYLAMQPAPSTNLGIASQLRSAGHTRVLFMPHYYPKEIELDARYSGNRRSLAKQLDRLCKDAERLEQPLVIGELGARRNVRGLGDYLTEVYDELDARQLGALYWDYGYDGDRGYGLLTKQGELSESGKRVVRPYLELTHGTPKGWAWYPSKGVFVAEWFEEDGQGHTKISLPRLLFGERPTWIATPPSSVDVTKGYALVAAVGGKRRFVAYANGQSNP